VDEAARSLTPAARERFAMDKKNDPGLDEPLRKRSKEELGSDEVARFVNNKKRG